MIWIFPKVVTITAYRLASLKKLVQVLDKGLPVSEWEEREALRKLASENDWPSEEFFMEDQILENQFGYWTQRMAWYSVVALMHSLVESQLFACADTAA